MTAPALSLHGVEVTVDGVARPLLRVDEWTVRPGEHWAVVGANGAGKSTLLHVAAGRLEPARGQVEVLGEPHGAPGLRDPRLRLSTLEGTPRAYSQQLTSLDVVALRQSGPPAMLGAPETPADRERARALLGLLDAGHLAGRRYGSCSQGERQRVLLARALMREPGLLLLDEPVTALDLPGREALLRALERVVEGRPALASLTITHHLEELPGSTTHALLLRAGDVLAAGPVDEALASGPLSDCFGVPVEVTRLGRRWLVQLTAAAA